jgi:hypothetical protein
VSDSGKYVLDTCLIKYRLENIGKAPHSVGLRFLLDTLIGDNDGVPFTLPGEQSLVKTMKDFPTPRDVPDFIQVLERPNLQDPGMVLQLNLRVSDKLKAPDRVSLTKFPPEGMKRWEVPMVPMADDSSVILYWQPAELKPKQTRDLGFTYGLGSVSINRSSGGGAAAKLGVTVGGSFYAGGELSVVALISDPNTREVSIEVPTGLTLLDAKTQKQQVPKHVDGRPSPVTWRLRAAQSGTFTINVSTEGASRQTQGRRIRIEPKSLF